MLSVFQILVWLIYSFCKYQLDILDISILSSCRMTFTTFCLITVWLIWIATSMETLWRLPWKSRQKASRWDWRTQCRGIVAKNGLIVLYWVVLSISFWLTKKTSETKTCLINELRFKQLRMEVVSTAHPIVCQIFARFLPREKGQHDISYLAIPTDAVNFVTRG